mmetsp:Transcript_4040/g.11300  ORF Transcript_4040/g.11300 Transcript_4040/m.11300 type:complete len:257 (+) Transcript_4040:2-772(+)
MESVGDTSQSGDGSTGRTKDSRAFAGQAHRLGSTLQDPLAGAMNANPEGKGGLRDQPSTRRHGPVQLTLYENGFVAEGESFRPYDSADAFAAQLQRREVPRELEFLARQFPDGNLQLSIVRRQGRYEPPAEEKQKTAAFVGEGRSLVGRRPTPEACAPPVAVPLSSARPAGGAAVRGGGSFCVQIKLASGKKAKYEGSADDTIIRLYDFASSYSAPGATFTLSTTFPRRVLEPSLLSLQEAGLKNALVVQTLTTEG